MARRYKNIIRTPYQVGAVVKRQEPRRQLAGADHGREDDFAPVVYAIAGDGYSFRFGCHDTSDGA